MTDTELHDSLNAKLQDIRVATIAVARGYHNGFFLWGRGGTSKSFTVFETLEEVGADHVLTNSRLSAKALFSKLSDRPDAIHVLEDVETLLCDKTAAGLLRSALWGQMNERGVQERLVTWEVDRKSENVVFTGGIIIISNRPLADLPELAAVGTRIDVLQFEPTSAEIAAKMREIAGKGYSCAKGSLTPEECVEVAETIIERSHDMRRPLDLRMLVKSYADVLLCKNEEVSKDWRDLLETRMKGRVLPTASRKDRRANLLSLALRIANLPRQERLQAWQQETEGRETERTLYRMMEKLAV